MAGYSIRLGDLMFSVSGEYNGERIIVSMQDVDPDSCLTEIEMYIPIQKIDVLLHMFNQAIQDCYDIQMKSTNAQKLMSCEGPKQRIFSSSKLGSIGIDNTGLGGPVHER